MTDTKKDKRIFPRGLLVLGLVILTNPIVNIFDYLPDLFGYLIIFLALGYFADRVPYFEEARVAFRNLAIVSGAKIPSYFIMTFARGQNYSDNDVKALFAFTFSVIEVILLVSAIQKLFRALSYLGQRSEAASLISPFSISKKRKTTPEALMKLCYFFVIYKTAFTALPELLLLTRGVSAEDYHRVFNLARLYPYTIIFAVVSVFVLGIIVCKRFSKFLLAIYGEGRIYPAADAIASSDKADRIDSIIMAKRVLFTLGLFSLSSLLMLDPRIEDLSQIDILPDFLFGVLTIFVVIRLSKTVGRDILSLASAILYSTASLISFIVETAFLSEYGYGSLAMSKIARGEFIPVMICDGIKLLAFIFMMIALTRLIARFIAGEVGVRCDSDHYSRSDARLHSQLKARAYLWCGCGCLCITAKLLDTIFRYPSKVIYVTTDLGSAAVATSLVPWFGIVNTVCSFIFIGFTFYLFSRLDDEVKLKYFN